MLIFVAATVLTPWFGGSMKFRLFVFSLLLLLPSLALPQTVGTAYLSSQINWSQTSDLYFTVVGGPPNTCGDFLSTRNGFSGYNSGSVCTDGSGNVTRGPWSWANTSADQTDTNIRIQWPNGTTTNFTTDHVWDKTCPTVHEVPFYGGYPFGLSGYATDDQWGAGFDNAWTRFTAIFFDDTTSRYWNPATGNYDSLSPVVIQGETTTLPSHGINWFFDPNRGEIPPAAAHVSSNHYTWTVFMTDGDIRCSATLPQSFVY
jgi:hypothetical protein